MVNWIRYPLNSYRERYTVPQVTASNPISRQFACCALFAVCLFISCPSLGFNLGFLDDAPIAEFDEKDIEIMLGTLTQTLNSGTDGVEVKWNNPKTGNNGTITPLNTTSQDGKACRRTLIKTFSRTFSGSSQYRMCKDDDGVWKVVTSPTK